jgi:cation diffusion facilitator CzcD-associated flavoprotein CzcO
VSGELIHDHSDFLINASGFLNNWRWPQIEGLDSLQGVLVYSADWDQHTDLQDKTVAVIGSGSSGIQIVAKLQPLTTFIRQPTWVTPGFGSKYASADFSNFDYTSEQKTAFARDPQHYLDYRKGVEHELNKRFWMLHKDSPEQRVARSWRASEMRRRLGERSDLADFMVPNFALGCRLPTSGPGYLEALAQPNMTVITGTEISCV